MFRTQLVAVVACLALLLASATTLFAQPDPLNARLVIAHLAPFATGAAPVTVTIDGHSIGSITYKQTYPPRAAGGPTHLSLRPDSYALAVYAGTDLSAAPLISQTVTLAAGKDYTAAAVGGANAIPAQLLVAEDDNTPPASTDFRLRVIHAAPFTPQTTTSVDVVLENGTPIPGLQNIPFGSVSSYIDLPSLGPIDVKLLEAGTQTEVFNPPPLTVGAGEIVTLFAIGGANGHPGELFRLDGGVRPPARVRAANFASYAPGQASVDLLIEGQSTPLVDDLRYGEVSGYVEVPEGAYTFQLDIPENPAPNAVVADAPTTVQAGQSYTLVAIGAGANVRLLVLSDDTSPPPAGQGRVRIIHAATAPAAASIDVRTQDGTLVPTLGGLTIEADRQANVPAGTYDLKITTAGGATTLLDPPPFTLADGAIVTFFVAGDGENQYLEVFSDAQAGVGGTRLYLPTIFNAIQLGTP